MYTFLFSSFYFSFITISHYLAYLCFINWNIEKFSYILNALPALFKNHSVRISSDSHICFSLSSFSYESLKWFSIWAVISIWFKICWISCFLVSFFRFLRCCFKKFISILIKRYYSIGVISSRGIISEVWVSEYVDQYNTTDQYHPSFHSLLLDKYQIDSRSHFLHRDVIIVFGNFISS